MADVVLVNCYSNHFSTFYFTLIFNAKPLIDRCFVEVNRDDRANDIVTHVMGNICMLITM